MVNEELMTTSEADKRVILERIVDSRVENDENNRNYNNGHEMVYYPLRYTSLVHKGFVKERLQRHASVNRIMDDIRMNERKLSR